MLLERIEGDGSHPTLVVLPSNKEGLFVVHDGFNGDFAVDSICIKGISRATLSHILDGHIHDYDQYIKKDEHTPGRYNFEGCYGETGISYVSENGNKLRSLTFSSVVEVCPAVPAVCFSKDMGARISSLAELDPLLVS